jgi:serine/threonine-protein kinase PknK
MQLPEPREEAGPVPAEKPVARIHASLQASHWNAKGSAASALGTVEEKRQWVRALSNRGSDREVESQIQGMEQLVRFSRQLSEDLSEDAVFEEILLAVAQLDIAERVLVVIESEGELKIVRQSTGTGGSIPYAEGMRISRSLARRCLEANETLVEPNLQLDPEFQKAQSIAELKLKSAVCVPLRERGAPFGVLYLDSRSLVVKSDSVIRLLEAFAGHASLRIASARALAAERSKNRELVRKNEMLCSEIETEWESRLVGQSPVWRIVIDQIRLFANSDSTVILQGETGTGKDLVARALRDLGIRTRHGPFVVVNCASVQESLLDAEMFGTRRGGFTGALDRGGLFESADGGTLFLNEIADMVPALQVLLLRFLEDKTFTRVGTAKETTVDVRFICATNRDLPSLVAAGKFRRDLFYRINQVPIQLPPLRDRKEDIPLLVSHFLESISQEQKPNQPYAVSREATEYLIAQDWPGNVRELENLVKLACGRLREGGRLEAAHFAPQMGSEPPGIAGGEQPALEETVRRAEREALEEALRRHGGNVKLAAKQLGVTRQTVYNLKRKHALPDAASPSRRSPSGARSSVKRL